ncbi:MAG: hypothetical protein Q8R47_05430 [Nanoarchaeota archaeon]|nr:hypothetical protein [Nanoarchaeota archaeon]
MNNNKIYNKISPYFLLSVALAAIIITLFFTAKIKEGCDTTETLLTSVKVKLSEGRKYVGFDMNRQNLTFGILTPGAMSKKTVSVEYTKNATTYVWAEGNASSWTIISPKNFEISPGSKQEVTFTLLVPSTAKEGEYNGRVVFCYQDK